MRLHFSRFLQTLSIEGGNDIDATRLGNFSFLLRVAGGELSIRSRS